MAINQIETGYKPEFSLGALYAGENARNAEDANMEALDKIRQENAQSRVINPMEAFIKKYESDLAKAKSNDPNYIPGKMRGDLGLANSQDAAGQVAMGTIKSNIDNKNAENEAATPNNLLLKMYNAARLKEAQGGQTGFPMSPQQPATEGVIGMRMSPPGTAAPTEGQPGYSRKGGSDWFVPKQAQAGADAAGTQLVASEYAAEKSPVELAASLREINKALSTGNLAKETREMLMREREGVIEAMKGGTTSTLAIPNEQPQQLAGGPSLEQLRALAMSDIPFEQRRAIGADKTDAMERMASEKTEAAIEIAKMKKALEKHDTTSQERATNYRIAYDPKSTPEQVQEATARLDRMAQDDLVKNPSAYKQTIDINKLTKGKVPMTPNAITQQRTNAELDAQYRALKVGETMTDNNGKVITRK